VSERIVFEVEVEGGVDPISGLLRLGEREVEFAGWIGLASALEQILSASANQAMTSEGT
jgi:hypothetical protein